MGIVDKVVRTGEGGKVLALNMVPSGCDSDGVLELYMQKPADSVLQAGHGYLSACSFSLEEETWGDGDFDYLKISVTIEEDPRLKAFSVFSFFGTRGLGIIKHCPLKVYCGDFFYDVNKVMGKEWKNQTDTFGLLNKTWEPEILEFKPKTKNKIGMIKGHDDLTYWNKREAKGDGFYGFDDHYAEVKLFGSDVQTFSHSVGVTILDYLNKERWENSLLSLNADESMMEVAEAHASYMIREDSCSTKEPNQYVTLKDEIRTTAPYINFEEYNRVTFCKRNILAPSLESINLESIYEEAIKEWSSDYGAIENVLRESYNAAGFGVSIGLTQFLTTRLQNYYTVYVCVDLGKIIEITTRQTGVEALASTEGDPVEHTEAREGFYEGVYQTNYTFEIGTEAKFALDSHNPICRTHVFRDDYPIPSGLYYLYGHYNDISVLNEQQTRMANFENWPEEKKTFFTINSNMEIPDPDPREYPVLMLTYTYSPNFLEAGVIEEGPYRSGPTEHWKYKIAGKEVRGFSQSKFSVGDWVVIQKGTSGSGEDEIETWFIVPTSSKYYENVSENIKGVG